MSLSSEIININEVSSSADPACWISNMFNSIITTHIEDASKKWNFDFKQGKPINDKNHSIKWELISN